MRTFLREVKTTGEIPFSHKSHDHLNEQKDVPLTPEASTKWKAVFEEITEAHKAKGEEVIWGLVDGFLLYWDEVHYSIN